MITHNPREVLIHRCLMGERLTPGEKNAIQHLATASYCSRPALLSNIQLAITGKKYRKVVWEQWIEDFAKPSAFSPVAFCRVNPDHLVIKDFQANGQDDESFLTGHVYISDRFFKMAKDSQLSTSDLTIGVSRLMDVFNVSEDWGKICIPAHPESSTVEFSVIDSKTDPTPSWKMPPGIRKMESAKYVPRKRRKLLPGIVQRTIKSQDNARVVTIGQKQDIQTEIFKQHVMQTTVGKELMAGPGNGQEIINILFEHWWSPHAIQRRLREERQ